MPKSISIFSPSSVSNVGPGFDILGFALNDLGDIINLSLIEEGFEIASYGADLPIEPEKNVATVALQSLAKAHGYNGGFKIEIEKKFKPGSGLGSSASSAAGAVFAANQLLELGLTKEELIPFALDGEEVASGQRHGDNIVPCMLGGFIAVKSVEPYEGFHIDTPEDLKVLVIFPDVPIKTAEARKILPQEVPLKTGIQQAADMAGLIISLMTADYQMIKGCLADHFGTPYRKRLIPFFDEVNEMAMDAGAYGFNISGSGPAMFAFFRDEDNLEDLKAKIVEQYKGADIHVRFHESGINKRGCEIL